MKLCVQAPRRFWKKVLLFFFGVVLFALRYFSALPEFNPEYVGFYRNREVHIRGQIREVSVRASGNEYELESRALEQFGNWYPVSGRMVIRGNFDAPAEYGDSLEIFGLLLPPQNSDPRIAGIITRPLLKGFQKNRAWSLQRSLFRLRSFFTGRLNEVFPEPGASLAAGILFGERGMIPADVMSDVKQTGLTHILALSGFNIVILISFLRLCFSFFSKRTATMATLATIILFVLMVGAPSSVVRAAIMGSLQVLASAFGRPSAGLRALFLAAFAMLLVDPFLLIFDIGFQLSFTATLGILVLSPRLKERFEKLPEFFGVKEMVFTTWAAQAFTTPLLLYYFGGISTISLVANIFVLPLIPALMLGSFLALFIGKIAAAPAWLLFQLMVAIIHFFASVPFAFIDIGTS